MAAKHAGLQEYSKAVQAMADQLPDDLPHKELLKCGALRNSTVACWKWCDAVQEYCRRLKAMRWQAIGVRAEESDQPVIESQGSYAWHFLEDFRELGEGDMDVLAVRCAEAGLTHLFKAALKLQ